MTTPTTRFDSGLLVEESPGPTAVFHDAGILDAADLHTARAICRIGGETDEEVRLALALTVRALRHGSVCIDPRTVHATVFDESETEIDSSALPWPEPEQWALRCARSRLVADGAGQPGGRPLRMVAGLLYLERYWLQEEVVRRELQTRRAAGPPPVDRERLEASLARLFTGTGLGAEEPDRQRLAAATSALSWVTVLTGGPGTGKTTTVARLLAVLAEQPGTPRIALAAPTGKAAARLEEAIDAEMAQLDPADLERLGPLSATTLHRLLGWLPSNRSRFRHDASNHLPHDVVVVDEMSMVSLTLMARLLEAVRPTARLILVGDPDQLSSVEAGAVLSDIAEAPGRPEPRLDQQLRGLDLLGPTETAPANGVVSLIHTWRYGETIRALAAAIRASDPDTTIEILRSERAGIRFTEADVGEDALRAGPTGAALRDLAGDVRSAGRSTLDAARAGDIQGAVQGLEQHRLLCAHRRGPYGVARWGLEVERWLAAEIPGYAEDGEWYVGRPLLVTANDYDMGLYNGDTGVIVNTDSGIRAAFSRGAKPVLHAPARLDTIQTVHAMTVHRAQGSQFARVAFVVPPSDSPLLTRELLYTAVTRAREQVHLIGTAEAIRRAVLRPANRASGLRTRLSPGE